MNRLQPRVKPCKIPCLPLRTLSKRASSHLMDLEQRRLCISTRRTTWGPPSSISIYYKPQPLVCHYWVLSEKYRRNRQLRPHASSLFPRDLKESQVAHSKISSLKHRASQQARPRDWARQRQRSTLKPRYTQWPLQRLPGPAGPPLPQHCHLILNLRQPSPRMPSLASPCRRRHG